VPVVELTEAELVAFGEAFGAALERPAFVGLEGDLGAGKTTLAAAILRGAGVRDTVTSPTYALVHTYDTPRGPAHHADLYRLDGPAQLAAIGWDELLRSPDLVLVEWPERAAGEWPATAQRMALAHLPGDPGRRRLTW
jgi:tRNA threonylcarbamoyladenosine biosynthesis protein TsaE